jgi:DNA-binding beta-propeller fold protein YncE
VLPVSAIAKDGSTVYVAEVTKKHVLRIDTTTDEIVRTYTIPDLVAVAIPSHQNDTLWVGTVLGRIYTISTDSGLPVGEPIEVPWSAGWLSFTPDGKKLISVHAGPGIVLVIDVTTRKVLASLDMGKGSFPEYGAVSPDGRFYWVTLGNGDVKVIDLEKNSEIATLDAGAFSFGVRISPDGNRAFITTVPHGSSLLTKNAAILTFLLLGGFWNPAGEIVVYDTTTFEEISRISTAGSPTIMSYAGSEG